MFYWHKTQCKSFFIIENISWAVVTHIFNPSTQEVKALCVWGQPALLNEFQNVQGYTRNLVLKN